MGPHIGQRPGAQPSSCPWRSPHGKPLPAGNIRGDFTRAREIFPKHRASLAPPRLPQDQCLHSPDATFTLPPYVERIKQWDTKQRYHRRLREEGEKAQPPHTVPPLPAAAELSPAARELL